MRALLDWLGNNLTYNIMILWVYYLMVVMPHEIVGRKLNSLFEHMDRSSYNLIVAAGTIVCLFLIMYLLFDRWRSHPHRKVLAWYILGTILLIILSFVFLFVINIEAVHFPQYAIFAILAFPVFNNSFSTFIVAMMAGALDELYQYIVLTPHINKYYDLNDVVIDMIGAGVGLIILKLYRRPDQRFTFRNLHRRPEFWFLFGMLLIFLVGLLAGVFSIYGKPDTPFLFTLVKEPLEGFWFVPPGPPARFHILRPLEGLVMILMLLVFYYGLNRVGTESPNHTLEIDSR